MVAAKYGRTEVIIELVKAGANLNLQNMVYISNYYNHMLDEYNVCLYRKETQL